MALRELIYKSMFSDYDIKKKKRTENIYFLVLTNYNDWQIQGICGKISFTLKIVSIK